MHASQVKWAISCSIMRGAETSRVVGTILWPVRTNHLLVSPIRVMNVVDETNSVRIFYDDIQD
jgi:hypothetical protein